MSNLSDQSTQLYGPTIDATVLHDPFPGEFRLVRRLGGGGFGEVWLADDLSPLARQVALKFVKFSLPPERISLARAALHHEARLLAGLRHPHIVTVHAWKQVPGLELPCLVLQYIHGGSLEDRVQQVGPLLWSVAARHITDIAEGLALLHARGVIHRDVKPGNMLHDPETDEALLTDLGIAARLSDPGHGAGTLRYMAPEAFRGVVSPGLDVFGLAASLFALVAGEPPFLGKSSGDQIARIETGLDASDLRLAGLPAELDRLVRAGLSADPGSRPTLPEFVREVRGALNRSLADSLTTGAGLALRVLRRQPDLTYHPVATTSPRSDWTVRDMKRVPADPGRIVLASGDRVRLEVTSRAAGYLSVFNIGPTGNLHVLCQPTPVVAGEVLNVADVEMMPPTGRERVVAVWTRQPRTLGQQELSELTGYQATRDMVRVRRTLAELPAEDWRTVVVELEHR